MSNYWVGVVSRDHVRAAVEGGFCQLSHGKLAPLEKLQPDDRILYYSPHESIQSGAVVQAFTAVGKVLQSKPYQVDLGPFQPYRRAVQFFQASEAPIRPLLAKLSFTRDQPSWGRTFRRGTFQIEAGDYRLIAQAMHVQAEAFT